MFTSPTDAIVDLSLSYMTGFMTEPADARWKGYGQKRAPQSQPRIVWNSAISTLRNCHE